MQEAIRVSTYDDVAVMPRRSTIIARGLAQRHRTGTRHVGALAALAFLASLAIPARPGFAATPFDGRFVAEVQGQQIELTLEQSAAAVQGLLQAPGGQPTQLSGQAEGNVATGLAANAGGLGAFEARRDGDALALTLAQAGPDGSPQQVRLEFRRAGAPPARAPVAAAGDLGGDPRLVGRWSKSESYRSGEFTAASETLMEIAADGRFAYGAGRVLAGTAGVSGDSGRGAVQQGEWRARGRVLSVRQPGGAWEEVGRYEVSDAGMLIYFRNGSKELWYRQ